MQGCQFPRQLWLLSAVNTIGQPVSIVRHWMEGKVISFRLNHPCYFWVCGFVNVLTWNKWFIPLICWLTYIILTFQSKNGKVNSVLKRVWCLIHYISWCKSMITELIIILTLTQEVVNDITLKYYELIFTPNAYTNNIYQASRTCLFLLSTCVTLCDFNI